MSNIWVDIRDLRIAICRVVIDARGSSYTAEFILPIGRRMAVLYSYVEAV